MAGPGTGGESASMAGPETGGESVSMAADMNVSQ